jgi:hypothetical protein
MTLESLGHIRLIRKLGEGARAQVYLARLRDGGDDAAVAIKVFREHVDPRSVSAEIEALSRAEGPHTLDLLDLTTTTGGVHALILERLARGSLATLLRDREWLAAGEAITILAPLASALARVHRHGAVHAGIRAESVLFDAAGTPVLACFGRAFPIARELSPAALSQQPGVALDLGGFSALARAVLARVDDPAVRGASDFASPGPALESHEWLERFSDRLFDSGEPCAVDFSRQFDLAPALSHPEFPARIPATIPNLSVESTRMPLAVATTPLATAGPVPATSAQLVAARLRGIVSALSARLPADVIDRLERVRQAVGQVRPRMWVLAGIVGVALIVALVALGPRQVSPGSAIAPAAAPTSAGPDSPGPNPVGSDDPVEALVALLLKRERCIAQLSVLCLDGVDQPGSAALAADQSLVRGLQSGAELPASWGIDRSRLSITERLGDSALIEISDPLDSEPASILLMKGEAGWRVRDYLSK